MKAKAMRITELPEAESALRAWRRLWSAGAPCLLVLATVIAGVFAFSLPAAAQDWFRTGTGLGVTKPRVAVADFAPRTAGSQPHAGLFTDVVSQDLSYSGILEVASKSFYPTQVPSTPAEFNPQPWTQDPVSVQYLAFGNLTDGQAIQAWFYDVRSSSAVLGKVYTYDATNKDSDEQTRRFAHQFADAIVAALSGGVPGIASTQIAFVSTRSGNKEIWMMDYDGANQHQLTFLRSISLTPRWSPDATRIAFTCYPKSGPYISAQICMYSTVSNMLIAWPRYPGTNSSPAWSPDGSQIMFMSSMPGTPELYIADANGNHPRRLTHSPGASTEAAWNPKTGQQVAFVSDRGGTAQLYMMDADGSNVEKVDLADKGYVVDPAWSPNGQLLAFSWMRPNGNYDLYVMDIASHDLVELTRDAGRNERPSWAPDGRHIVFESTRTGTRQIWSMLADGSDLRQLTTQGDNESPNWSTK